MSSPPHVQHRRRERRTVVDGVCVVGGGKPPRMRRSRSQRSARGAIPRRRSTRSTPAPPLPPPLVALGDEVDVSQLESCAARSASSQRRPREPIAQAMSRRFARRRDGMPLPIVARRRLPHQTPVPPARPPRRRWWRCRPGSLRRRRFDGTDSRLDAAPGSPQTTATRLRRASDNVSHLAARVHSG